MTIIEYKLPTKLYLIMPTYSYQLLINKYKYLNFSTSCTLCFSFSFFNPKMLDNAIKKHPVFSRYTYYQKVCYTKSIVSGITFFVITKNPTSLPKKNMYNVFSILGAMYPLFSKKSRAADFLLGVLKISYINDVICCNCNLRRQFLTR